MTTERRLRRLRWGVHAAPLVKPYELSFGDITVFDVVWIVAEDEEGRIGVGEAVPLPGYNWETLETIRGTVAAICDGGDGALAATIVERCRDRQRGHPFAVSAVMAGLDMPLFLDYAGSRKRFAISAPVSGDWPVAKLRGAIEAQLGAGYNFIKVKVGRNLDSDGAAARCVLTEWPDRPFRAVFDANQAYTDDAALAFAEVLSGCASGQLQWFEQPIDRSDWDGMERLCRTSGVPIVLDECIYDEADVKRAAAIGAFGVKLKLIKNFGIAETLRLGRLAHSLGLIVVFGNGVASDIGNLGEYLTLAAGQGLFTAASECTGFVKLRKSLLGGVLKVGDDGQFGCVASDATITQRIRDFTQVVAG
jgi:L-alanine-DL-glutamate epimerase-like enolase superfamily enzyme